MFVNRYACGLVSSTGILSAQIGRNDGLHVLKYGHIWHALTDVDDNDDNDETD